jgi:hypothetical protein
LLWPALSPRSTQTVSAAPFEVTRKVLILQTHFSVDTGLPTGWLPKFARRALFRALQSSTGRYGLSRSTENESVRGRWYKEFESESTFRNREKSLWSSWDNRRSFWIQKEYLLETIRSIGFDVVMEQYDGLGPNIADAMLHGEYKTASRGTFIGVKTKEGGILK